MADLVNLYPSIIKDIDRNLLEDCVAVFTARSVNSTEDYSIGSTFFIKSNENPRSGLESIAQQIFQHHTKDMKFDPNNSGAEWWTQVIDETDDIGIHWDRDYGAEEDDGLHIYPYFGSVTYLSDIGAPTLVFNKEGTKDASGEIIGTSNLALLSFPSKGNHITFRGDLLHAAPFDIIDESNEEEEEDGDDDDDDDEEVDEESKKVLILSNIEKKRITFLVNIWIDHIPSQAITCSQEVISKLKSKTPSPVCFTGKGKPLEKTLDSNECDRDILLQFNNTDVNYDLILPFPSVSSIKALKDKNNFLSLTLPAEKLVTIQYSEEQPESDSDSEEYDDDDIVIDEYYGEEEEDSDDENEEEEGDDSEEEEEEEVQKKPKKRRTN